MLTDLFDRASSEAADWWESQSLSSPALFGVSWAGEQTSLNWMDIGREFTELWHHQQQVRMAVGADALGDPRYLRSVLALGVRALPHTYRYIEAEPGANLVIEITGDSGGYWTLTRHADRWTLADGAAVAPAAHVRIGDDDAWQLLFNALTDEKAAELATVSGRAELARPLLRARSVIV